MFDDSSLMLEAAARGIGVALARSNLVRDDLGCGRLTRPLREEVEPGLGYFLVWRADSAKLSRIQMLRGWLLKECASDDGFW
jgi:LysR family glycine cleavage system transcriptional activator